MNKMAKRTGPTNGQLQKLILALKKKGSEEKVKLWRRLAEDLEKPTRQRRAVNLSRISRFCKADEIIVVPGKVLASGDIKSNITVSAFSFSQSALEKIEQARGKSLSLFELMEKCPKGQKVRIIG